LNVFDVIFIGFFKKINVNYLNMNLIAKKPEYFLLEVNTIIERFAPFTKSVLKKESLGSKKIINPAFYKFSRSFIKEYQWLKLRKCIRHAYKYSPYYHKVFRDNNLKPNDIKDFKDLVKIPATKTEDLQKNPKSFFTVPEEKFSKVFTTAGTTGKPKKAYFTKKDLDKIISTAGMAGKIMWGLTDKDVIRISFEVGYGTEMWGNSFCLERAYGGIIGALTLVTGRLSIEEELEIIKEYKPNVFTDVSSRVNYLTKEMKKLCDLKSLGIKKFLIGAEPTPSSMRKNIEKEWNADVYIGYGTTEIGLLMAGECERKHGFHLGEINYYTEVIDPKTGEQLEDGEIGELHFTTFDREGMPLIRYNSHDLGRIIPGDCECGVPIKRIEIKGRSDDLIPIGAGDNLFTKMFDEAIFSIPEVQEYQVIFEKKNDKDLITIVAESEVINDTIRKRIIDLIMNFPEIKNGILKSKTVEKPIAKLVKPNTFDRKSIKFKRLIDKRNLYE
jgi:phenylacetate-CoA ligase